jgi:hypothetical protein
MLPEDGNIAAFPIVDFSNIFNARTPTWSRPQPPKFVVPHRLSQHLESEHKHEQEVTEDADTESRNRENEPLPEFHQ